MLLCARSILPVSREPLADGALLVRGDSILAVGPSSILRSEHPSEPVFDLGAVVLLPGLVNAHCHLDYTDMAGMIPTPRTFPDWVKMLLSIKSGWTYSDYAQSWLNGARMLVSRGVTAVADIEAVPELFPDVLESTPLRVLSLQEMTGVKSRRLPEEILQETLDRLDWPHPARVEFGLSPHALYSTSPELLRLSALAARQRGCRVATHLSESREEFEMYVHRRGTLFQWLKPQREMSDCGVGSPIQQAHRVGLLAENFMAVHVNYLLKEDAGLLARTGAHVAHCPRSHAYFGHEPFPYQVLANAGVNICLGTDSLVSVKATRGKKLSLDMFEEMRAFATAFPTVPPSEILAMATWRAAAAIGREGSLGELSPGAQADIIAVPFDGPPQEAAEAVLHHCGIVSASLIAGQWVFGPKPF